MASVSIRIQGHIIGDMAVGINRLASLGPSILLRVQPDESEERVKPGNKHFVHTGTSCTDKKPLQVLQYMHLVRQPIV